jgi:hypothetical protein
MNINMHGIQKVKLYDSRGDHTPGKCFAVSIIDKEESDVCLYFKTKTEARYFALDFLSAILQAPDDEIPNGTPE